MKLWLGPGMSFLQPTHDAGDFMQAQAGLCSGLESIVESWVSKLELHSSKLRNISQERLEYEGMIAIVHCHVIIKEALSAYWSKVQR